MSSEAIALRMLSSLSSVSQQNIRTGDYEKRQEKLLLLHQQ